MAQNVSPIYIDLGHISFSGLLVLSETQCNCLFTKYLLIITRDLFEPAQTFCNFFTFCQTSLTRNFRFVEFSKASKHEGFTDDLPQQFNAGYHSDSRIVPGISHASSHSYSSQNPSVPLSTFDPRCFYEPGAAVVRMAAEDPSLTDHVGSGFMQSTPGPHSMRFNTHLDPLTSPVYINGIPHSVGYGNRRQNIHDDLGFNAGKCLRSQGQPLERVNNQKNSQDYDRNMSGTTRWPDRQRPLNNTSYSTDSDNCTGIQYSCADMSVSPHEMHTPSVDPVGSRRTCNEDHNATVTSGSYIIDPYDLCDQIDDLFFRDKLPISYARPR